MPAIPCDTLSKKFQGSVAEGSKLRRQWGASLASGCILGGEMTVISRRRCEITGTKPRLQCVTAPTRREEK